MRIPGVALGALLCLAAGGAPAQDHAGHGHGAGASAGADSPATRGYRAAHARMMHDMAVPYTGDPDVDFRLQMIPHHEGAIAMARVALDHAKDPWTRQLAEAVIVEQQREIAEMRAWLATRGIPVAMAGEPSHTLTAQSYRSLTPEAGTRAEARGQSWAPGAGTR